MASLWCWSLLSPKPNKQVASESVKGAELALQRLGRRCCETCDVEEGQPCKRGGEEAVVAGGGRRVAGVEVNGDESHSSKLNSSFAHSVVNMVGMLIGTAGLLLQYGCFHHLRSVYK